MKNNLSADADFPRSERNIFRPIITAATGKQLRWALEDARWGRLDPYQIEAMARHCVTPQALLAQACHDLGLAPPRAMARPLVARLPLLCRIESRGWGVVVGVTPSGLWMTRFESGFANFAELALRNACFPLPGMRRDATAPFLPEWIDEEVHPTRGSPHRSPLLAAIACGPGLSPNWQHLGTLACLLVIVLVGSWLGLALVRKARWRAWRLQGRVRSQWFESQDLERQQERILRQSIFSDPAQCASRPSRPTRGRRDGHRST